MEKGKGTAATGWSKKYPTLYAVGVIALGIVVGSVLTGLYTTYVMPKLSSAAEAVKG